MKLQHILILQNKIDLVKEVQAMEQHDQILAFVKGEAIVLFDVTPLNSCGGVGDGRVLRSRCVG